MHFDKINLKEIMFRTDLKHVDIITNSIVDIKLISKQNLILALQNP